MAILRMFGTICLPGLFGKDYAESLTVIPQLNMIL